MMISCRSSIIPSSSSYPALSDSDLGLNDNRDGWCSPSKPSSQAPQVHVNQLHTQSCHLANLVGAKPWLWCSLGYCSRTDCPISEQTRPQWSSYWQTRLIIASITLCRTWFPKLDATMPRPASSNKRCFWKSQIPNPGVNGAIKISISYPDIDIGFRKERMTDGCGGRTHVEGEWMHPWLPQSAFTCLT